MHSGEWWVFARHPQDDPHGYALSIHNAQRSGPQVFPRLIHMLREQYRSSD
jgi:hypothetical protein